MSRSMTMLLALLLLPRPTWAADTRLSLAAMNGEMEAVQTLIKERVNVNDAQGDGMTALHWAALREDLAMTQLLLRSGANVYARTRLNQMTPLFMAAKAGNAAIVEALLKAGADPRSASTLATTPLMLAAASGSADAVGALLKAGAPVNARDANQGQTALMFAAASGRTEVIRLLAANGAEVNATSLVPTRPKKEGAGPGFPAANAAGAAVKPLALGGMTALHFAAREGYMDVVRALVESGADVNVPTASDRMSTLILAIVNGRYDIAKYLLEHGADPKPATAEEATALFAAIDTKWAPLGWYPAPTLENETVDYLDLMKLLLDKGADVNARMNGRMWMRIAGPGGGPVYRGETAFLRAAQANDVDAMRLLISRGANPSITTISGVNALMFASGAGHRPSEGHVKPDSRMAAVRYLVEDLGFDANARDKNGFTPLHSASALGDKDVIRYLITYGGDVASRANALVERTSGATVAGVVVVGAGQGETVADMANGPAEKTLVFRDVIDLLVSLGSKFSDNCRASLCVNKERPVAPARPGAEAPAPAATPPATKPETKKPGI